jgi:hypothetical protein
VIESLIARASRVIMRWCEREFAPASTGVARPFRYDNGRIDLSPYDLRAVTSITLDTDLASGSQTLLTTSDYRLGPLPAPDGVYQWVDLYPCSGVRGLWWPGRFDAQATILGDWGWPAVPDDVEHACIITVAAWLRGGVSGYSRTYAQDEATVTARPLPLPYAAQEVLASYKQPVIA